MIGASWACNRTGTKPSKSSRFLGGFALICKPLERFGWQMKTYDEINQILHEHLPMLQHRFGVARIGVFGSVVRGEQRSASDVDILVDFDRPIGLINFMQLESHLAILVGSKVDLVSRRALKPHIGKRILDEVRYVN